MKASITAAALAGALAIPALAQQPAPRGSQNRTDRAVQRASAIDTSTPPPNAAGPQNGAQGPKTFTSGDELPAPTPPSEIKEGSVALPTEPLEPYLLTKE
ncbi:MAG TPA: hypothetical protein VGY53_09095, partial [Isosphaeraceae bacterium]|nr:hypothetical protein [Isosphaeraceae bacterium]